MTQQSHGAEDVAAMEARNVLLEKLYRADGRMDPTHPRHGIFTGLIQQQETNED